MSSAAPIVFLGPSMPVTEARRLLDADYRRPIRRGDLERVPAGSVVGMIDGVFAQDLAVSPREVHEAIARGVRIVGGASMGALRAAEVRGVLGVGLVYAWYRDGVIARDDEVALVFDPERGEALSVPLVNVRFAVDRLCRPGTLDRALGERIVAAAAELPYPERGYRAILARAGLADRQETAALIAMLEASDLKREDAQVVLETVERMACDGLGDAPIAAPIAEPETRDDILIWESGDRATFDELVAFLAYTGTLEHHARAAIARFALEGNAVPSASRTVAAQSVLAGATRRWGWLSAEEARVTLADLGIVFDGLAERCREESAAVSTVRALIAKRGDAFDRALRAQLVIDDMALKREVMRLAALRALAARAPDPAADELAVARRVVCKCNDELELHAVRARWAALGFADEPAQDRFIADVARARRAGRELIRPIRFTGGEVVAASPKAPGERRFALPLAEAREQVERLRATIGITRVGLIGELADLGGVQVAQAARPDNAWSSSYGSGKSLSRDGAIIGSILEETEKWAQEQFAPPANSIIHASFRELDSAPPAESVTDRAVDPATLDLPYDTVYRADVAMPWFACRDLMTGGDILMPLDLLTLRRRKHDICYTQRGARKHLATNGLGSGFTRAEALLHAICEFVERHALRIAELYLANPGGLGPVPYRFVDLDGAGERIRELAQRLATRGAMVRALDITSEIAIPTMHAVIFRDGIRADGHAAHPDPEVALEMALLEAAQTISCVAAGGREDLSIHARSLGRHERPRPLAMRDAWFWLDPDPAYTVPRGYASDDIADEVRWCLARLADGGVPHVIALDLSTPAIAPVHVVRVAIPGLESNNPFYTGIRARRVLLEGLAGKGLWR